jgi:hypothetical protein
MSSESTPTAPTEFYDKKDPVSKANAGPRNRPIAVTIAAALMLLGTALQIGGSAFLLSVLPGANLPQWALDILYFAVAIDIVLGVLFLIAAVGMLMMKSWARKLGLGLAIFGFALFLIGSKDIISIINFAYYFILIGLLMKTDVRTAFD